jgi:hypothetical protein
VICGLVVESGSKNILTLHGTVLLIVVLVLGIIGYGVWSKFSAL